MRELKEKHGSPELVWVAGDHEVSSKKISLLSGFDVVDEHYFEVGGKKCIAIHGHQFDHLMKDTPVMRLVGTVAGDIYKFIQLLDSNSQKFSRWLKRQSKTQLHVSDEVARGAMAYAHEKKVDYIFCGHTHQHYVTDDSEVYYWNSNCWTDVPSTHIAITSNGTVNVGDEYNHSS
ncbi:hypothetical protein HY967_05035 [Candidatus Jorgensenbacteria bacterium]|nr:hypothetical protein [Candidatus Jorgensenbacteria bacterium]